MKCVIYFQYSYLNGATANVATANECEFNL